MSGSAKQMMFVFLVLVPLVGIAAFIFYSQGYKQFGSPSEYKESIDAMNQAKLDSLRAIGSVLTPESLGDSTMVGMDDHATIFKEEGASQTRLEYLEAMLDSMRILKEALDAKEKFIIERENIYQGELSAAATQSIIDLAVLYDNMKAGNAVTNIMAMDDTLATYILSNMQQANAAKLLGAIAESDVDKASRINKMLSEIGTK